MLNFEKYEMAEKDRTESPNIRYDKKTADLVSEASYLLGVSEEDFICTVLHNEAKSVVEHSSRRVLSPEDAETFLKAITSDPGEPSAYAIETARLYRERVVRDDG